MTRTRNQLRDSWANDDAFATTLLVLLVETYSVEALTWLPETIAMEIEEDFDVRLPRANIDRLMTAIALQTTDDFYKSLPDFVQFCNILSGDSYDPRVWDLADSEEVAWGITEAMIIEPPEEEEPFTDEIRAYIGATLDAEGIIQPPDILKIALRGAPDIVGQISGDFSDDPEMFGAIYDLEGAKTSAINQYVKGNLLKLGHQLEQLPLAVGETAGVVQKVFQTLA